MIGADVVTARVVERLTATWRSGQNLRPVILQAHEAYAKCAAEACWLASLGQGFEEVRDTALRQQLEVVAPTNFCWTVAVDPEFDAICRGVVQAAFDQRVSELAAGWSL